VIDVSIPRHEDYVDGIPAEFVHLMAGHRGERSRKPFLPNG
jgi:hypothetical protein